MPVTNMALNPASQQFGGDGDWNVGSMTPPQTITGTFAGTGSVSGTFNVTIYAGTTPLTFTAPYSQNLSHTQTFAIQIPPTIQAQLDALPHGTALSLDVSSQGSQNNSPVFNSMVAGGAVACFATGTLIATARGEIPVESLRVGDLVVAAHGGAPLQPVMWIGHSKVSIARHRKPEHIAPICIKAGALAQGVPFRDLRLSPDHAVFIDGRLVPARLLVNDTSIVQELWCPEVTYWHVELPAHGLLVAEGTVSESYFDDGNRTQFDNFGVTTLFKDFASERHNGRYAKNACYPLIEEGAQLDAIRARIADRAELSEAERNAA